MHLRKNRVPWDLEKFWIGHANKDVTDKYAAQLTEDVEWRKEVVHDHHSLNKQNRTVTPSEKPGLGVDINEAAIQKHPFQQELPQQVFHADGSVGDW